MKRCLLILAAALLFAPVGTSKCEGLQEWFNGYNERYFLGALPSDTVVEYGYAQGNVGITFKEHSQFHIIIDTEFNKAPVQAHETLLHEQCHIATWGHDDALDGHGTEWRACMNRLYIEGAFDGLL